MTALVIKIGDRYFYNFGKGGRVLTAWSLAGARLFDPDFLSNGQSQVEKKLQQKKVGYSIVHLKETPSV